METNNFTTSCEEDAENWLRELRKNIITHLRESQKFRRFNDSELGLVFSILWVWKEWWKSKDLSENDILRWWVSDILRQFLDTYLNRSTDGIWDTTNILDDINRVYEKDPIFKAKLNKFLDSLDIQSQCRNKVEKMELS